MDENWAKARDRYLNSDGCMCDVCLKSIAILDANNSERGYPAPIFHTPQARLMSEHSNPLPNGTIVAADDWHYRQERDRQERLRRFERDFEKWKDERSLRVRVGDVDRERVIAQLDNAFIGGYLDACEHDGRVGLCFKAKHAEDLTPLTHDLPKTALMNQGNVARYIEHPRPKGDLRLFDAVAGTIGIWLLRIVVAVFLISVLAYFLH